MPAKKDIPADVDAYIANATAEARPHLAELRNLFITTVPQAEEKISWAVPFYRYLGELGGFDAFTKHVSFGIGCEILDTERSSHESQGYKVGKGTIQIPFGKPVPAPEITRMLKAKAAANESSRAGN